MARRQLERGYDSDSSGEGAYDSDGDARISSEDETEINELNKQTLVDVGEGEDEDLFASDNDSDSKGDSDGRNNGIEILKPTVNDGDRDEFDDDNDAYVGADVGDPNLTGSDEDESGPPVSKFNGDFSESDNDSEKDGWEYSKEDVNSAAKAHQKHVEQSRSREKALQEEMQSIVPEDVVEDLIVILEPTESPMEALARLGPLKKAKRKNKKTEEDSHEILRKHQVNQITDLCAKLERLGVGAIYDLSREELMRLYRKQKGPRGRKRVREETEEESEDAYYNVKEWEFKWSTEDEVLGPYSGYEMDYWKEEGHFNENVLVRKIGGPFTSIGHVQTFR